MVEPKIKSKENSSWEKDFNSLFQESEQSEVEMFLHLSEMIMHNQLKDNNLSHLYKTVGLEGFLDIVAVLQNQTIVIPSLEEVRDNYTLAVVYYYREVLGWSWKQIKASKVVNFNTAVLDKDSSISYGIKINRMSVGIRKVLDEELIKFGERELNIGK